MRDGVTKNADHRSRAFHKGCSPAFYVSLSSRAVLMAQMGSVRWRQLNRSR